MAGVKCSYAEAGIKKDVNVGTIDVVADVKTERVWPGDIFIFCVLSYLRCNSSCFGNYMSLTHNHCQIVVLGGSGFVGSAICKAAVSKGIEVISLSRCSISGRT